MFKYLSSLINQIQEEVKKVLPGQILVFITHGKTKNNNKLKISAPTWNNRF